MDSGKSTWKIDRVNCVTTGQEFAVSVSNTDMPLVSSNLDSTFYSKCEDNLAGGSDFVDNFSKMDISKNLLTSESGEYIYYLK